MTGIDDILVIIFVIAKLTGHFGYSWWWVFSPFWIEAGLAIASLILFFVIATPIALITGKSVKFNFRFPSIFRSKKKGKLPNDIYGRTTYRQRSGGRW